MPPFRSDLMFHNLWSDKLSFQEAESENEFVRREPSLETESESEFVRHHGAPKKR